MNVRKTKRLVTLLAYLLAFLAVAVTLFPIFWIFTISIKTQRDAFAVPPVWFFQPVWSNYLRIWQEVGFMQAFRNSVVITVMGVALALLLGIPAAYALNRMTFRGKRTFTVWLLVTYMFPEFLFIIPMYVLYQDLGLYDTQIGMALVYQVFVLPFAIWLLRSFFADVPVELEDAARIDGCTRWQTLRLIYFPLTAPGISATAILTAIWIWNELTIALALTFDVAKTVTVAVAGFRGYAAIDWGGMTAASIVSIIPMLIFAAIAQRYIVEGLTLGAVK
ncbi:MAG: carbohydrate ABC transporter permease [Anaerolineales bacterium]|nr:carbohydrate ABC transporter permease [Anaerolineales bacterium]MDD5468779.1 carbohydrate ABC transporter permease [Anaerolineales bacterium]